MISNGRTSGNEIDLVYGLGAGRVAGDNVARYSARSSRGESARRQYEIFLPARRHLRVSARAFELRDVLWFSWPPHTLDRGFVVLRAEERR